MPWRYFRDHGPDPEGRAGSCGAIGPLPRLPIARCSSTGGISRTVGRGLLAAQHATLNSISHAKSGCGGVHRDQTLAPRLRHVAGSMGPARSRSDNAPTEAHDGLHVKSARACDARKGAWPSVSCKACWQTIPCNFRTLNTVMTVSPGFDGARFIKVGFTARARRGCLDPKTLGVEVAVRSKSASLRMQARISRLTGARPLVLPKKGQPCTY
ncbi:hypothetical protein BD413DRAFT_591536 [Trametes elegans]|nr:hypothetical protein BD413DRAFT_591536 [Trametes elegans]